MSHPLFSAAFGGGGSWTGEKAGGLRSLLFGKSASSIITKNADWRKNLWQEAEILTSIPDAEAASVRTLCEALAIEVEAGLNPGVKGWQVEEVMRELPHVARCLLRIDDPVMRMQLERRLMPRGAVERFDALVLKMRRS
eukprot:CAMPEP_0173409344 /NCGR_PEP_ID=MMETSP1356-20130122/71917_1 /TAXON_ID=77927 ORGANISM="Hemiselmis virescens, Strain PCC157" /NCGR_SAMPLE_ID=MMETSP1356 /ASSEMBLY_ACC=CAM_ASM_000847 /LENGTH=138 /DNA_ID=CAMNT_0014370791 /DNA_START=152 /DNA_END=565 /DNA_ORIENTATION=-